MSLDGVWPLARTLDHAGPMARTPEDLALLLGVLAPRRAGRRPVFRPARRRAWRSAPTCTAFRSSPRSPRPTQSSPPTLGAAEVAFPEAELIVPAFRTIQLAEGHETHRRAGLYPERAASTAPTCAAGSRWARVDLPDLLAAHADRETVRAAFARLFAEADVLLTPAVPIAPPRIEDERADPALRDAVSPTPSRRTSSGSRRACCRTGCS